MVLFADGGAHGAYVPLSCTFLYKNYLYMFQLQPNNHTPTRLALNMGNPLPLNGWIHQCSWIQPHVHRVYTTETWYRLFTINCI